MLIEVNKMLKIRNIAIWPNVVVAPMAGVTDMAFRKLLWELAEGRMGLTVSEFISVDAQPVLTPRHLKAITPFAGESPFTVQLFGAEPERMADAAQRVQELNPTFIEINAGCPMKAVIGRGGGSSLLKDLPRLRKMLQLTKANLEIPLLLKTRIGWDSEGINIVETAKIAEDEGIELLTIHGRTRQQGYNGLAHWPSIAQAARAVNIPVVGNGDIASAAEAHARLQEFPELAGVSIGRALMHNPWLMAQVADLWSDQTPRNPDGPEIMRTLERYLELLIENGYTLKSATGRIKQLVARILRFVEPDVSADRARLLVAPDTETLMELLRDYLLGAYQQQGCQFISGRIKNLNGGGGSTVQEGCQFA